KMTVIGRIWPQLEHTVQPGISRMISHVVRHDILQPAHTFAFQPLADLAEAFQITNRLIDNERIGHIITMRTSFFGLEEGSRVDSIHLKLLQVIDNLPQVFQSESGG